MTILTGIGQLITCIENPIILLIVLKTNWVWRIIEYINVSTTVSAHAVIDWLGESGVPFCIVFTKADKLGPVKARMNAEKWMHALEDRWEALPPYFITSSEKKMGRDEVLDYIDEINKSLAGE